MIAAPRTIGYLIPEFPGQTHNFFWRERSGLQDLGVQTHLLSTRCPPTGIMSPDWARAAQRETVYMLPLTLADAASVLRVGLGAGLGGWGRCLRSIALAPVLSATQRLRLAAMLPVAAKLVATAHRQGWRHVHVHSCADAANLALFATLLDPGLTYSMTLHNPLCVYGPNQEQKWGHAAFGVVINQRVLAEVQQGLAAHLPPQVVVAPMGVDCDVFQRQTPYVPFTKDSGQPLRLVSCGRLNPIKGHGDTIAVVRQLRDQGWDLRLEIAGEDEQGGSGYRRHLEQLVATLNLQAVVTFLGAVSEEAIRAALGRSHLFVLASLDEGVPVAAMEAMAMEVPVIVTDVGGVTELVTHECNGLVIQPNQPLQLAAALLRLMGDPALALRLSQASRQTVVESFGHRRSARVIANLLASVS
jgi:colanic acid/amylovoran biosynthesis glycosyltransferase